MNTLKTIGIAFVTALVVVLVAFWLVGNQSVQSFGSTIGATFFPHSGVGARSLKVVTSTTDNTPAADGTLSVGGGSATVVNLCATATWNPASLGTSSAAVSATTTDITLAGALTSDTCSASLSSATTTSADIGCHVYTNGTGTITLYNNSASALDLATGTAKVCIIR